MVTPAWCSLICIYKIGGDVDMGKACCKVKDVITKRDNTIYFEYLDGCERTCKLEYLTLNRTNIRW